MKSTSKKAISPGAVHTVPADLRKMLLFDPAARKKWEDIYAARTERMDLLGDLRQETGNQKAARRARMHGA
jgi:hypothetical protein